MDSAMQNGKINEKYFGEKDGSFVSVIQTRAEDAVFENEKNLTYTVKLAGMTGEYYIGLHMADSVGNETDVIYDQTLLSVKDVDLAYAKTKNVDKVVTKINRSSFAGLMESSGVYSIVTPKNITANLIMRYARAMESAQDTEMRTLYRIVNNKAEAMVRINPLLRQQKD